MADKKNKKEADSLNKHVDEIKYGLSILFKKNGRFQYG